ncbi:MAG: hypothetical protein ACPL4K_02895, partial [Candidatus Margulisiibacteriota bacterium]
LDLVRQHPGWFDPLPNLAEYRRAAFENLDFRAQEFRKLAQRLKEMKNKGYMSDAYLKEEWDRLLRMFDPDYVTYYPVARKNIAGDERMVRKVENVATGLIMRGLTVYKGWFTETPNNRGRVPAEEWISGTWTRVPNPLFSYGASLGTLEGSKFIWVPRQVVLTPLQENNEKYLSTSKWIASVDNDPDGQNGFSKGNQEITIRINGHDVTIDNYYYPTRDQNAIPSINNYIARNGSETSDLTKIPNIPPDYKIATKDSNDDLSPLVMFPPAFDYQVMMDKNDIQLYSYLQLPAILERERKNIFLRIMLKWPHPTMKELEVNNPYPDKTIDESKGIEVVDANVEIQNKETGLIIPYKVDRSAITVGVDESVKWQSLEKVKVTVKNQSISGVKFVYGQKEVDMPSRDWPQYLKWLFKDGKLIDGNHIFEINNFTKRPEREGQMAWLKIHYTDETIAFVRCPDGKRPTLFNKDLYANGRP